LSSGPWKSGSTGRAGSTGESTGLEVRDGGTGPHPGCTDPAFGMRHHQQTISARTGIYLLMSQRWWIVAGASIALISLGAQSQQPVTRYGIRVQPGPMDSVLLKDYSPESSLVVPESHPKKARFPAIDVHAHTGQSRVLTPADVDDWVRTMDEVGVETTIVFT